MKYCAFLRGVNVKGTNMKMAEACKVFCDEGMQEVSSILASGNIIFSSDRNRSELKNILEKAMSAKFNYEAFLFLKNESEIVEILKNNPFEKSENKHIYVFVGIENLGEILIEEFEKYAKTENEEGKIMENTFYWQVSKGNTLNSAFGKILGKKTMKDKLTSRNINTFEKIINTF